MISPVRYVRILLLSLCVSLAAIALFNFATDAYGVFRWVNIPQVNWNKPGEHNHDRLVKAYAIERLRPDALFLGTSRVQFGMDPNDLLRAASVKRPYNAGLVDASPYMMLRYLQHADAINPVHIALVGLDPLMFDLAVAQETTLRDFTDERMATNAEGEPKNISMLADFPPLLLSWDALDLSYQTLVHQENFLSDLLPNGQRDPRVLDMYSRANGTLRDNVKLIEHEYIEKFSRARFYDEAGHSATLDDLRRLISFCRSHKIRLHLFFTPGHVRMLEIVRATHQWEAVSKVKRDVIALVEEGNEKNAHQAPVALWDFGGPNVVTTEEVPPSPASMRHYWETSHFRSEVGSRMVAQMLGSQVDTNFGVRLLSKTFDATMRQQRSDLDAWRATHRRDVEDIAHLVQRFWAE